jgi:transcriptional regulator with XRE-family HTH domain
MNFFEKIGKNIQVELDKIGWTKSLLADKIGVSRQVLQKIINGSKAINAYEISQIANVLGTTADDLINNEYIQIDDKPQYQFMGHFSEEANFDFIKSIIRQYMDMEEDLGEIERLK